MASSVSFFSAKLSRREGAGGGGGAGRDGVADDAKDADADESADPVLPRLPDPRRSPGRRFRRPLRARYQ